MNGCGTYTYNGLLLSNQKEWNLGAPGWLSTLSVWLQLRSWSHGLWVQAPASASVLTAQSLELASDSVSHSLSAPLPLVLCLSKINTCKKKFLGGAWVAQSVKRPTSAQVMTSRFRSSSPASGSVLTARSLEPASDSVSPSLSAPPQLVLCLSMSLKKINKCKKRMK